MRSAGAAVDEGDDEVDGANGAEDDDNGDCDG